MHSHSFHFITRRDYYALKTDSDQNTDKKKRTKRLRLLNLSLSFPSPPSCCGFHHGVHIITEHTSKIPNQSAQYARPGRRTGRRRRPLPTSLPPRASTRLTDVVSRSPRLWLIIVTAAAETMTFLQLAPLLRRTRGIWRVSLAPSPPLSWWLNT